MDEPLYVLWLGFRGGALLFWLEWFIWVNLVKWPMQIVKHIHYFLLLYVWINKNHKAVKQCWIVLCDCSTVYVKIPCVATIVVQSFTQDWILRQENEQFWIFMLWRPGGIVFVLSVILSKTLIFQRIDI